MGKATGGLVQHTFCAIANFVQAGRISFARNIILVENNQFRSSQQRKAWERCMKPLTNITHKYDVKEEMENKKTFCKALCGTKTVRGIY